jgi:hypothetical protein
VSRFLGAPLDELPVLGHLDPTISGQVRDRVELPEPKRVEKFALERGLAIRQPRVGPVEPGVNPTAFELERFYIGEK